GEIQSHATKEVQKENVNTYQRAKISRRADMIGIFKETSSKVEALFGEVS
ncbi:12000_t:CDS:1, partial [Entrophospora sp. SA101]